MGRLATGTLWLWVAMGLGCGSPAPTAPPDDSPPAADPLAPTELLRRLSFDLRGRPPSDAEYERVREAGDVDEALLTELLQSDELLDQVEQWHAEVLWPNISRYRLTAAQLTAVQPARRDSWEDVGYVQNNPGTDIGADPALVLDAEARESFVLAFEYEGTGITLRGGRHAQPGHFCDMSPEAEYPDPSVVGTAANRYTVPAERSPTGEAYEHTYYSEDPDHYGLVQPIYDWEHCQNYCFRTECGEHESTGDHRDEDGDGNHDCYADLSEPGVDPAGRHVLDPPGMRCPDGYERILNSCDFAVEFGDGPRGRKPWRRGERSSTYNSMRDGWRWQTHYWSRGVPIRTCAVEAQQREFGLMHTDPDGAPTSCARVRQDLGFRILDPSCGCGPEGVFCQPSQREHLTEDETRTEHRLRTAIEREPLRIVRSIVERDEDYLSILTTRRSFVNGPLALAWAKQAPALAGQGDIQVTAPGSSEVYATVDYEDEEWHEIERDPHHSGILTTLEFLLRFPTARARVAQFRRVFACSAEFDYAPDPDPDDHDPDIAERSGCASCHARLETDGLYFGRFPDRSGLHLAPEAYPLVDEACRYCVVGDGERRRSQLHRCELGAANPFVEGGLVTDPGLRERCETRYAHWKDFGDREAAWAGHLWPTIYREPGLYPRVDAGPRAMVESELGAGDTLQLCASRSLFERLVRRPPSRAELAELVDAFEASGRSYRELLRAVLTSEAYRASPAGEQVAP